MIELRFAPAALLVSIVLFYTARADAQKPFDPCCGIIAVDAAAGIVTAKVNATGNVFQFKLNNPATLAGLKPGQAVYANFTNHQVSLDGFEPCCGMTSGAHPFSPVDGMRVNAQPNTPPDGIHPNLPPDGYRPSEPCCGIVAVDAVAGIVSVKVNATGSIFQFKPSNAATLASLKPGQAIYANFTNHQVSLDGRTLWAGQQLSH
jgi:hypothetical protein